MWWFIGWFIIVIFLYRILRKLGKIYKVLKKAGDK